MELTGEMFCKMIIDPFNSVDESKNVKKNDTKLENLRYWSAEVWYQKLNVGPCII